MNIFKKMLATKEVKKVLAALYFVESELDNPTFHIVKQVAERAILAPQNRITHYIVDKKMTPIQVVYITILDITSNYLSSGQYHFYRGELNPQGEELYRIFNIALENLETSGYLSHDIAEENKAWISKQIADVG